MRKEIFAHFAFWFSFFILISIFKNNLALSYWPFWVGGAVGTILPDIDHLIYVFFLSPQELTSQRVNFLLKRKEIARVVTLLHETRNERKNLVFHTFIFEIVFFIFTFFIVSSTTSAFVRGLVLSMSLHLVVDQFADFLEMKNLGNWGQIFSEDLSDRRSILLLSASFLLVCVMGFLM